MSVTDISQWRPIPGYSSIYRISTDGRIYSAHQNKILSVDYEYAQRMNIRARVGLTTEDGRKVKEYIHRLVAQTYVPNPEHKPTVNHINGNKWDNRAENLEWATRSEQASHSTKLTKGRRVKRLTEVGIITAGGVCFVYPSVELASEMEGCRNAWKLLREQRPRKNGDRWIFMNQSHDVSEEWRCVVWDGIPTGYQVSNLGRVKNMAGRILHGSIQEGYIVVGLNRKNKDKFATVRVHTLVANAFIGECPPEHTVDHINQIRDDNRLINLRYADASHQALNSTRRKKHFRPVVQCDLQGNHLSKFNSANDAAAHVGVSVQNLYKALNGDQATAAGFRWKYNEALNTQKATPMPHKKPIEKIDENGVIIGCFESVKDAAQSVGRQSSGSSNIRRAVVRNGTAYGFKWRYK